MEKTVYIFPQKGLVVSKGNLHKHHDEHVTLDNSPINEIKIISIGSKRIKISYTMNGKEVTAYTRTNINDFITGCVIDDKIIYGPFVWARINIGLELVKVGSDRYKKAQEVYISECSKGIPIKDWVIGGIYKNSKSKLRYLGVCTYWYVSKWQETSRGTKVSIKERKQHMWENVNSHSNYLTYYSKPKVTELLEVSKESATDILKDYRNSYTGDYPVHRYCLKNYTIRPAGYSLVGEPIMNYLNKFKDGQATF
jgi:hypothetical protein